MWGARAWLVLAAVAWCARAGPGPPAPAPAPAPAAASAPAPAFAFAYALYNLSIPENSGPRTAALPPAGAAPLGVRPPARAHVRFRIRHGDKDKFFKAEERVVGDFAFCFIRTRAGHADVLNRERKDFYKLEIRATAQLPSGKQIEADTVVAITITDVNDLSPLFYPTEYDVLVPEDTPAHASVARVAAEDADLGLNGEIYYSIKENTDQFAVHPTSGVVTITRPLAAAERARHELTILARDRQSLLVGGDDAPAARASLVVRVARANLHAPELKARRLPELVENSSAEVYAIVAVTDRDAGEHGRIASVEIVGGDPDGHFRVRPSEQPGEWDVLAHALLDRERTPRGYNLTLRATDAGRPPRASYLTLPVTITDANDNAPVFSRELYECTVSEMAPTDTPIIRLKVSDRDEGRNARVYIEIVGGNEGGEFRVNPDTGVLYTARELDAELRALHTLTVAAVDHGNAGTRKQSSAKVQVAVLDANDNDPVFEQEELDVAVPENGPAGAVVARVTARDADSGENAYISYSLANLQPVPFDVDHFSGAVRTARVLDYESMRRVYMLRVRASDWGLPYRRQAELRLRVRLLDVNDNRPQFERVDCVGYLPRRLSAGAEIVTLSAIDFDAGDVVSYRIVGGNDDNCFALDTGSGVLSLACDLASVRADSRVLNVTATDGTHFADPTSLVLHLTGAGAGPATGALECRDTGVARRLTELLAAAERSNAPLDADEFPLAPSRYGENLHAPEFVDFPVEVKVNESVALGTTLVRLAARDRDLGYNGLLTFGISGGDPDSAFRIEPDTGELQVIGYLDRERESEYYLNVSVWDSGKPRRAASRLLPITVLDVNDNPPRFEKTLASFRVTENAINGTAIFRANATDRDAGEFARVTYSLAGGADGEFCVERDTGMLRVCAPLDRERRALYELTLRATDGGGRSAEALVRVAVDDVNDCAPRFALASYSARVPEDVPRGTLVAVLDAFDPDLGAGGRLTYSLPDQTPEDAFFTVDELSGVLRTAKRLDFEEKQVHGVTVRATDGGQPALWAEAALIVEVLDVDENAHAPQFAERVLAGAVREDAPPGTRALHALAADADAPGRDSRLAYYIIGGSGMAHFSIDDTGVIRTLSPLDRESTASYWLTACAQDHGLVPKHTCVEVYIEVEDVNDMAPWPARAAYAAAVPEHCAGGTRVAVVRAADADAAPRPANISYTIVAGNPDGLFSIDEYTGEIVTTGRTLDREATPRHALEVSCSDGELATTVRVLVTLADINDHAPAFTQRFYELRVPAAPAPAMLADQAEDTEGGSAEWDSDDEDDGSGARPAWDEDDDPQGTYIATVGALDDDAGANGTVRYSWRARGAARGVLRVHVRSGRIYATRPIRRQDAFDITVRACDGGSPARCGVARVSVRGAARGGGAAPALAAPAPLQAAELDAPGFLLAVLQATDPEGDRIYYDIIDGDEWNEFLVGREDGSLVLAKRLLHERRARYALTVAASDGASTATAVVNITVINDANEAGVSFSRSEYTVDVSEAARPGEALAALRAGAGADGVGDGAGAGAGEGERLLYGLHAARAPASARLFRVHELTGVLELAQPLDRESAHIHELTVWARDQAPRASRAFARVLVRVHDEDEHAPEWQRRLAEARLPRGAAPGALVAALRAADRDAGDAARIEYSLAGGDAGGLFAVDAALGDVTLASRLPPAPAPREYTLAVRAANPPPHARANTLPLHITIVEPDDAPPQLGTDSLVFEVGENEPGGVVLGAVEARGAALRYWLQGGEGRFALNPAAGLLATAAPLDYEECSFYNLTVTVFAMGGGSATAHVAVHVLDRNEFPPVFVSRRYSGRVSEAAARGALVARADADAPLVLATADADSPAHQQRAFEILQPAAAALFAVHPTTGALLVRAPLDYETARRHEFTVKVVDAGSPRLPSDSTAAVVVEVEDVNDCAPVFERAAYEATVLLPTAPGVSVQTLRATDEDLPANGTLKYDIIEGDAAGAFAVSGGGLVTVARPESLPEVARLRVRASDGRWAGTARLVVRAHTAEPAGLAFAQPEYYGAVAENSTRPATIAVLSVLGAALNEHVEFSILNPVEGFEIGVTSGAVRSTGLALDREARDAYLLLVRARSEAGAGAGAGGARVALARLAVSVTDVNDNCPVFVGRPYAAAVSAGAEPGTPVFTVRADDADANDNGEVRYEMKRGHGELFRVDRGSGQVTLKQTPDAHVARYELVIAAFDGGAPPCGAEATLTVRVWAGGAAPRWDAAHYTRTAREDAAPGAALAGPLAARSPLQRPLIYSLVAPPADPATGAPLFEIHFDTAPDRGNNPCALVPALPLDFERARAWELVVRATDGVTGAAADALVSLRVTDVNDCPPELERDLYDVEVSEAAAPGTTIFTFAARDNDTGVNGEVTYSLSGDNSSLALFALDAASGALTLAAPLDAETHAEHRLLVTARDGGRPALADTAHLRLRVRDVNDEPPRLERPVISALVSEEAARGTVLARVAAWDPDASDATRLRYAAVDAPAAPLLAVDADTGLVSLASPRGWPRDAPRSLNVSVSDGAHATFARVKLTVAPANRHAPRFPHLVYEARVLENLPPPVLLTTVKADDEDAGEYGAVTYSIDSTLLRDTFALDATTGALTTRVPLDREARAEWEVPVAARDGGGRLRHTTVRVRVLDANDHAPEFALREYRAAARADLAPHKPFLTLAARDADVGDHARIRYELYDGELDSDAAGLFEIDPVTGALAFAKNASAFASRSVVVWARARDGGGRSGSAGVAVFVLGAGESAPRVAPPPPALFLREDAPPGTLLAELRADPAEPAPRYRLAPANHGKDQFALDASGRLVLAAPLDRERARELPLGIVCEAAGAGSPAPALLLQTALHVLDVNEHAPAFHSQPYVVHLAENTPPHSTVVRLMATDPDAGSNGEVVFSLGESPDAALFAVDARTGWVTTRAPLDREARAELRVPLVAADQAPAPQRRATRGTLVVRLQDYNDCPPRFQPDAYAATVPEDAAAGTVVARLTVTDADATAAPLAFLVASGDPRARFQLRPSGELLVARELDRELEASYELTVIATDGKFDARATVRVAVSDVNDNPPYCVRHRYRAALPEDAPPGTLVATLETTDADLPPHDALKYFLEGEANEDFTIHKETGSVRVARALDREARAAYALRMHAQDRARAAWRCSSELLVTLADVNDNAPRFSAELYSVTLPEDAELGTLVAKVHATDPDLGANRLITYSFVEEEGGDGGVFALAADSGVLTLRAPLDREAAASHRVLLRATDGGAPRRSSTAALRLTVADVNDNPPEFEFREYRAVAPELDAPGTEILRVRATSRDTGVNAEVSYSLVAGDDREDFAVDRASGAVSVARPLDYERRRAYLLTVQALDGGSPPLGDFATLNISVIDANDNAPVFAQASYNTRVREDAPIGTRILQLIADDADDGANGRVTYSVARGDRDGRFGIDADTGYLSVAAPLDRETTASYSLEVRARDRGLPALEASVRVVVEVLDANDNPPLFERANYSVVVQEDRPLGHALLKLAVTDADAAPNAQPYTFDFQAGNEAGAFRLEQDGTLRTAARFNHRVKERYALQVRVFDNGAPPLYSDAWVHVRVIEESQYPPVVTPLEVQVNSYLDEFPGGVLGRVVASDRDAYDTLTYAIAPPRPPLGLFEIDAADGTLRAAPRLDVGEYRLNVTVADGKFVSHAVVRVTVLLVSDALLAQAVVVRFRAVSAESFVLSHRKGLVRAVREAADCEPGDVLLLAAQPEGDGDGDDWDEGSRARRQVARDLDVALAVRAGGGWLAADALRRRLHAHLERVEERARLVVEELVRAACGGCVHGACAERVELRPERARAVASDVFALVAPPLRLRGACACEPGWAGARCEREATCAGAGADCAAPVPLVLQLAGDGYAWLRVERGAVSGERVPEDELTLSLRFRTRRAAGTLLWLAGRVDYAILEIVDGFVQFRMELGSGALSLRSAAPAADGEWHSLRLERRGAGARLTVDRRAVRGAAPPPAALLDARADRLLLGAALARHAHARAPEQVIHSLRLERRGAGARLTVDRRAVRGAAPPPAALLDARADRLLLGAALARHAHARAPEQVIHSLRLERRGAGARLTVDRRAVRGAAPPPAALLDARADRLLLGAALARHAHARAPEQVIHSLRLERRGAGARLTVDRRAVRGAAPPPAALLDARADRLLLGAALARHAHARAPEQVIHSLRLERRGAGARLTVDRRAVRGAAPPPAALLDARADRLLLGAALARHAHARAPEQVIHSLRLERRGAGARLTVDRRAVRGAAPPPAALLDARADRLLLGAALARHAHARAPEQVIHSLRLERRGAGARLTVDRRAVRGAAPPPAALLDARADRLLLGAALARHAHARAPEQVIHSLRLERRGAGARLTVDRRAVRGAAPPPAALLDARADRLLLGAALARHAHARAPEQVIHSLRLERRGAGARLTVDRRAVRGAAPPPAALLDARADRLLLGAALARHAHARAPEQVIHSLRLERRGAGARLTVDRRALRGAAPPPAALLDARADRLLLGAALARHAHARAPEQVIHSLRLERRGAGARLTVDRRAVRGAAPPPAALLDARADRLLLGAALARHAHARAPEQVIHSLRLERRGAGARLTVDRRAVRGAAPPPAALLDARADRLLLGAALARHAHARAPEQVIHSLRLERRGAGARLTVDRRAVRGAAPPPAALLDARADRLLLGAALARHAHARAPEQVIHSLRLELRGAGARLTVDRRAVRGAAPPPAALLDARADRLLLGAALARHAHARAPEQVIHSLRLERRGAGARLTVDRRAVRGAAPPPAALLDARADRLLLGAALARHAHARAPEQVIHSLRLERRGAGARLTVDRRAVRGAAPPPAALLDARADRLLLGAALARHAHARAPEQVIHSLRLELRGAGARLTVDRRAVRGAAPPPAALLDARADRLLLGAALARHAHARAPEQVIHSLRLERRGAGARLTVDRRAVRGAAPPPAALLDARADRLLLGAALARHAHARAPEQVIHSLRLERRGAGARLTVDRRAVRGAAPPPAALLDARADRLLLGAALARHAHARAPEQVIHSLRLERRGAGARLTVDRRAVRGAAPPPAALLDARADRLLLGAALARHAHARAPEQVIHSLRLERRGAGARLTVDRRAVRGAAPPPAALLDARADRLLLGAALARHAHARAPEQVIHSLRLELRGAGARLTVDRRAVRGAAPPPAALLDARADRLLLGAALARHAHARAPEQVIHSLRLERRGAGARLTVDRRAVRGAAPPPAALLDARADRLLLGAALARHAHARAPEQVIHSLRLERRGAGARLTVDRRAVRGAAPPPAALLDARADRLLLGAALARHAHARAPEQVIHSLRLERRGAGARLTVDRRAVRGAAPPPAALLDARADRLLLGAALARHAHARAPEQVIHSLRLERRGAGARLTVDRRAVRGAAPPPAALLDARADRLLLGAALARHAHARAPEQVIHSLRLERRGAGARLTVDRRAVRGAAPPPAALLDARADRLLLGAALARHAHARAPEQVIHSLRLELRGAGARLTVDRRAVRGAAPPPAALLDARADRLLLGAALARHAHARAPEQVIHSLRLERRGAGARLTVDRRAVRGAAPPPAALLDARADRLLLGAALARHAHARAPEQVIHSLRLERRGAGARLTVDRRAVRGAAPPPAALLDARADRLLLGAALARHAHARAPEQVTRGFVGCITDVTLGGTPVPLEEGAGAEEGAAGPRVQLVRRVRARLAPACAPLAPPTACASYPCLNGGTCRELANLLEGAPDAEEGYRCTCHARFLGRRCEVDGDPCTAQPCLHGGQCSAAPPGAPAPFVCACGAGLRGARCELGRWCGAEGAPVCQHGGACEEGEWGPSCRCRGYYGPRCEYDADECAGEPCLNGATCLNEPGSFRCLCPPDKTGMNCGNPLYSDAVMAGGVGGAGAAGARSLRDAWRWAVEARWPLAAGAGALLLLLLLALLPLALLRRRPRRSDAGAPLNSAKAPPRPKLSNLTARARPASCAGAGAALNNLDTLRSYGSAGDELEGLPPDIRRNLNVEPAPDRKPWSEQMHLHSFVDNKIYNDLKGSKNRLRAPSPMSARRPPPPPPAGDGAGALVGGYHWDCSDWCGGAGLPGISEVAGSERPDSSEPSPPSLASLPSPPPARRGPRPAPPLAPPAPFDTDSAPDDRDRDRDRDHDHDRDYDRDDDPHHFTDASSYLLHPDTYLPLCADAAPAPPSPPSPRRERDSRARRRDPDAASLITMLEERHSLLGGGSLSDVSARLCEIEESDEEGEGAGVGEGGAARHTDV